MDTEPHTDRPKGDRRQGTKGRHSAAERGLELYETPPEATRALLKTGIVPLQVWEPCAGRGAIARELAQAGRLVLAEDVCAYPDAELFVSAPIDFFKRLERPRLFDCVVTNPPFGRSDEFVRKALSLGVERTIVLHRLAWLQSATRADLWAHLEHVFVFLERLPPMHRDNWQGPKVDHSPTPFAWYVFSRARRSAKAFPVEHISGRSVF